MSGSRYRMIRGRLAAAGGDPARERELVDDLADELVQLRTTEPPSAEDPEVLAVLVRLVQEEPAGPVAGLAADVLATAGHRRGNGRAADIDAALVAALDRAVNEGAASRDVAPLVNALAELSATRPVPDAVPVVRQLLTAARREADPSLVALDGALAVLRASLGSRWPDRVAGWWPALRDDEPLGEAVNLARQQGR